MKPQHAFEAARPLANHCEELLTWPARVSERPEEKAANLATWCRDIARTLSQELPVLFSGDRLSVTLGAPEMLKGADILADIGPVAANTLLRCGEADQTLLLSFDCATAIALTDRSFGGEGDAPDVPCETLPRSAALLIEELAKTIAGAVAAASSPQDGPAQSGDVIIRSESAARLKPFDADAPCAQINLSLTSEGGREWNGTLALRADRLDQLVQDTGTSSSPAPRAGDPAQFEPFSTIPLPLRAVLAELSLSLGQLERLQPGDQIPIAVPREVPLRIGTTTYAHGTIGTQADCLALQLTRTMAGGPNP